MLRAARREVLAVVGRQFLVAEGLEAILEVALEGLVEVLGLEQGYARPIAQAVAEIDRRLKALGAK